MTVLQEKDYTKCCDLCLQPHVMSTVHCGYWGGVWVGCHETFANVQLAFEHFHKTTRGCRWPGNIEDFYRKDDIWHKKERKPEEEEEGTPVVSRNSSPSRGVEKRSTSNGSRDQRSRADRRPGRSWE